MATLLRPALLQGASLLLAGPPTPLGTAVAQTFSELGARVSTCLPNGEDETAIDHTVAQVGVIDMLIVDGAGLFDHGPPAALRACLDSAWNVTRAVINHAFLPAGGGGRVVYLTPTPEAGEHALAARAGLENLARTLSIEWARHHVNVLAIAPGSVTPADEVATLAAYLASPAGAYFSGCLLDLAASPRERCREAGVVSPTSPPALD
jgi:NAD(P)-dependent dehydrogenase (short-subunit alcohol dehydrogenase family)